MRATPPPVEVTLPDGRRERAMVAALYALSAGAFGGWLVQHGVLADAAAVLWAAAPVAGALCGWHLLRPMRGLLRWDGAAWCCAPTGATPEPCAVQLCWDLGGWLLLRVRGRARRARWCALTAAQAGAAWHGLRLALYHAPGGSGGAEAGA